MFVCGVGLGCWVDGVLVRVFGPCPHVQQPAREARDDERVTSGPGCRNRVEAVGSGGPGEGFGCCCSGLRVRDWIRGQESGFGVGVGFGATVGG